MTSDQNGPTVRFADRKTGCAVFMSWTARYPAIPHLAPTEGLGYSRCASHNAVGHGHVLACRMSRSAGSGRGLNAGFVARFSPPSIATYTRHTDVLIHVRHTPT